MRVVSAKTFTLPMSLLAGSAPAQQPGPASAPRDPHREPRLLPGRSHPTGTSGTGRAVVPPGVVPPAAPHPSRRPPAPFSPYGLLHKQLGRPHP